MLYVIPNALYHLFDVKSFYTDNMTQVLVIDDGEEMEDYNVDDYYKAPLSL